MLPDLVCIMILIILWWPGWLGEYAAKVHKAYAEEMAKRGEESQ